MKTQPSNRTAQALPICRLGRVARPRRSANGATVTSIFKLRQHRSSLRAFPRRSHFPSCKNIEIAPNQSRRWRSSGGKPPFPTCELPYALFLFPGSLVAQALNISRLARYEANSLSAPRSSSWSARRLPNCSASSRDPEIRSLTIRLPSGSATNPSSLICLSRTTA